jgi:hypothetical protein
MCILPGVPQIQCRRVMLLEYFGERFPAAQCDGTCDNCLYYKTSGAPPPPPQDMTLHAKALLHALRRADSLSLRMTLVKLASIYSGGKDKETAKVLQQLGAVDYSKVPELANPAERLQLPREVGERLLQHLVMHDYIQEIHIANFGNYGADYITEGDKGAQLLPAVTGMNRYGYGVQQVPTKVLLPATRAAKASKTAKAGALQFDIPQGPVSSSSSGRPGNTDSPEELGEDDDGWIENTAVPAKRRSSAGKGGKKGATAEGAAEKGRKPRQPRSRAGAAADLAPAPAVAPVTAAAAPAGKKAAKAGTVPGKRGKGQAAAPPPPTENVSSDEESWVETQPRAPPVATGVAASLAQRGNPPAPAAAKRPANTTATETINLIDSDEDRNLADLARQRQRLRHAQPQHFAAATASASTGFRVPYKAATRPPSPPVESISSDEDVLPGAAVTGGKRGTGKVSLTGDDDIADFNDGDDMDVAEWAPDTTTASSSRAGSRHHREDVIDLDEETADEASDAGTEEDLAPDVLSVAAPTRASAAATAHAAPKSMLSRRQQQALRERLEAYRKRWVTYWNYLSNAMVNDIVVRVPVTIDQLALTPGMGASKARLNGEGFLAVIYAFLEHEDLLHLFPAATPPTLPECPTWRDPCSEAAERAREEHTQAESAGGRRGSYTQQPAATQSFAYSCEPHDESPPRPANGSGGGNAGAAPSYCDGYGRSSYSSSGPATSLPSAPQTGQSVSHPPQLQQSWGAPPSGYGSSYSNSYGASASTNPGAGVMAPNPFAPRTGATTASAAPYASVQASSAPSLYLSHGVKRPFPAASSSNVPPRPFSSTFNAPPLQLQAQQLPFSAAPTSMPPPGGFLSAAELSKKARVELGGSAGGYEDDDSLYAADYLA